MRERGPAQVRPRRPPEGPPLPLLGREDGLADGERSPPESQPHPPVLQTPCTACLPISPRLEGGVLTEDLGEGGEARGAGGQVDELCLELDGVEEGEGPSDEQAAEA